MTYTTLNYELPSRSSRKYRGKYPTRINSFGRSKGVFHIELNNGRRYVALVRNMVRSGRGLELGADISDVLPRGSTVGMSRATYAGIILVGRVIEALRPRTTYRGTLDKSPY